MLMPAHATSVPLPYTMYSGPYSPHEYSSTSSSSSWAPAAVTRQHNVDDRPFVCDVLHCGRRFNRKFTLGEHMKTHTGEKPYVCPVKECSKRFTTSGNLARHKRLHASIKPFECTVAECRRSFPNEEKLQKHINIHVAGKTHTCSVINCQKSFSTAGNLTRHTKLHHPELLTHKQLGFPLHSTFARAAVAPASSGNDAHSLELLFAPASASTVPVLQRPFDPFGSAICFQPYPVTNSTALLDDAILFQLPAPSTRR